MNNTQNLTPLDKALNNVIDDVSLDQTTLSKILERQQQALEKRKGTISNSAANNLEVNSNISNDKKDASRIGSLNRALASAASICLLATLLLFWNTTSPNHSYEVAEEAVKNHLKLMPLDIRTQSIQATKNFFNRLDFSPVQSTLLPEQIGKPDLTLLGGRYCSIKGETAAQLRYQYTASTQTTNTQQSPYTLFQVPFDKDLHGEIPTSEDGAPKRLQVKGLDISMWVERGLLMVLVSEPKISL